MCAINKSGHMTKNRETYLVILVNIWVLLLREEIMNNRLITIITQTIKKSEKQFNQIKESFNHVNEKHLLIKKIKAEFSENLMLK